MNKGVIFFIVIVLAVLAIVFIPKNKDGVPAEDTTAGMTQEDLQGAVIESQTDADMNTPAELPTVDAGAEGVVEVTSTETTPAVTE